MSDQLDSEKKLFEGSDEEVLPLRRRSLLPPSSTPTPHQHRRVHSFGRFPVKVTMGPKKVESSDNEAAGEHSGRTSPEEQGAVSSSDDQRTSRGKGKEPDPNTRRQGTILGIGLGVSGKGSLTRIVNGVEVNFWEQVAGLEMKALENVLSLAKVEREYDMTDFISGVEYQGFNREAYIAAALKKISVKVFCQFAVLGALRGSNFKKIVDTSLSVPQDMIRAYDSAGFVKKPTRKDDLTILRCTAAIPHWCAYWMHKASVPKKIPSEQCPAIAQFPGAASLPMSRSVRLEHLSFSQAFSSLLPGGELNLNIYMTAYNNMIPISNVPAEVRAVLGASSLAEAQQVSQKEIMDKYGNQVAVRNPR